MIQRILTVLDTSSSTYHHYPHDRNDHCDNCQISLNLTGNAISNLSKAVESYTKHPTNMTHYQVFIIIKNMVIMITFMIIMIIIFMITMAMIAQDIKRLVLSGNFISHFSHACLPPRSSSSLLSSLSSLPSSLSPSLSSKTGLSSSLPSSSCL